MRNVDPDNEFPAGPHHHFFMDRFTDAFRAELAAFVDVVNGAAPPACTVADAVEVAWLAEAAPNPAAGTRRSDRGGQVVSSAKIAGAPISWSVCEVPGWGYQMAPQRVLAEMRDAGLTATELGPEGFLPCDPCQLAALLGRFGLSCVGMFAPVVLHDAGHDPVLDVVAPLDALVATNAGILVLAAATGSDGYDSRPPR